MKALASTVVEIVDAFINVQGCLAVDCEDVSRSASTLAEEEVEVFAVCLSCGSELISAVEFDNFLHFLQQVSLAIAFVVEMHWPALDNSQPSPILCKFRESRSIDSQRCNRYPILKLLTLEIRVVWTNNKLQCFSQAIHPLRRNKLLLPNYHNNI